MFLHEACLTEEYRGLLTFFLSCSTRTGQEHIFAAAAQTSEFLLAAGSGQLKSQLTFGLFRTQCGRKCPRTGTKLRNYNVSLMRHDSCARFWLKSILFQQQCLLNICSTLPVCVWHSPLLSTLSVTEILVRYSLTFANTEVCNGYQQKKCLTALLLQMTMPQMEQKTFWTWWLHSVTTVGMTGTVFTWFANSLNCKV